jgi:hypothetical protein
MADIMQTAKLSNAAYRLLHDDYHMLPFALQQRWGRVDALRWFRRARLGLTSNDGTFGGPDGCRRILQTTEAEICQYYA